MGGPLSRRVGPLPGSKHLAPHSACHGCSRERAAGQPHLARALVLGLALFALLLSGCKHFRRADTRPLDETGMSFSSIQELRGLDITDAEVADLAEAKRAGMSDQACVELLRIARGQKHPLARGEAVAALRQAGMSEESVLELARLNQLGLWVGEAQAMRLAGISDRIILAIARHRAQGRPTLSGPSLARLKNAGLSDEALFELVLRGVTDQETETIVTLRRRGWKESEILRHYPAP